MAARRPSRVPPPASEPPTAQDDVELLEQFCREVDHEEIEFQSWSHINSTLDLVLHIVIDVESAKNGTKCEIRWCKTINQTDANGTKITRVKLRENIYLPGPIKDGQILVLKGLGDEKDLQSGDLKVIIRIK